MTNSTVTATVLLSSRKKIWVPPKKQTNLLTPMGWILYDIVWQISIEPPFFSRDTAVMLCSQRTELPKPAFLDGALTIVKNCIARRLKSSCTFRSVLLALHFGLVKSCSNPFNLCQLVEGTWDKKTVPCFKDVIFKIASTMKCCDYFMWKFGLQDWQEIQPSTARLPQAASQLLRAGGWKV